MLAPSLIYYNNNQGLEASYQNWYQTRDNSALIPWRKWKDLQKCFHVLHKFPNDRNKHQAAERKQSKNETQSKPSDCPPSCNAVQSPFPKFHPGKLILQKGTSAIFYFATFASILQNNYFWTFSSSKSAGLDSFTAHRDCGDCWKRTQHHGRDSGRSKWL